MSTLRDRLVKLGSENKELRPHLRPILAEIDKQKVKKAVRAADNLFWREILKHFPEAAPGTNPGPLWYDFLDLAEEAVEGWVKANMR